MATENDLLVERAARGDIEPLLAKLRSGKVKTSGSMATSENDRGDPPDDTLWYTVLNAYGDGELSDEQYAQCHAAVSAGYR